MTRETIHLRNSSKTLINLANFHEKKANHSKADCVCPKNAVNWDLLGKVLLTDAIMLMKNEKNDTS